MHAQDRISANAAGRCVRTVHHLDHFTTPETGRPPREGHVEPYARVCVSAPVAAELAEGWGIKAVVIPNGVAYDRFAAAAQDTARQRRWRQRLVDQGQRCAGVPPPTERIAAYAAGPPIRAGRCVAVPG